MKAHGVLLLALSACSIVFRCYSGLIIINCVKPDKDDWKGGNNEAEHIPLLDHNSKFWPGLSGE